MTRPKHAAAEPPPAAERSGPESAAPDGNEELEAIAAASAAQPPVAAPLPPGALGLARIVSVDPDGVVVEVAGVRAAAQVEPSVHQAVLETACRNQELVLVTRLADGRFSVAGALRTQPTPGVDEMDEIRLEARRVELRGTEEVQLRSGIATIALRAVGEVETYADRIMSRAEEVQKIVARMLRLN